MDVLEALYSKYNHAEFRKTDPIGVLKRDLPSEDLELLSFVLAGLSYGRVEQIRKDFCDLIVRLNGFGVEASGKNFAGFIKRTDFKKRNKDFSRALKGWKHRLNTVEDLRQLFERLSIVLNEVGSLGGLSQKTYSKNNIEMWGEFLFLLRGRESGQRNQKGAWQGTGLEWFVPDLSAGGTSKRFFMWLRWMLRKDEIDLGVWMHPSSLLEAKKRKPLPCHLFVPLDTHVAKWCRENEVFSSKSLTFKQTQIATEFFKQINPEDPLRYDFAICQDGVQKFRKKS